MPLERLVYNRDFVEQVELLITVSVGAEFEIVEVRLAPSRVHIDFGEIEPDWM